MKVGYIGLGAMGRALASHLVEPFNLVVWDLNAAAIEDFVARGAETIASIADMGRMCEIVFLCLPRSSDVKQVLFGADGLAAALSAGSIVIDQTSGLPAETESFARELAERGIAMLDAPVAGGVPAALAGGITIMASGPDAAYEKAEPILRAISPKLFHCSQRVGDGQAVKLVNNMINSACRMATLEIVAVGRRLGLPLADIATALNASTGRNFITAKLLPAIIERRASADFALALMVKDLNQAIGLGVEMGVPTPISSLSRGIMQLALNMLGPQARLDDIVAFMESMTATHFLDQDAPSNDMMAPDEVLKLVINSLAACNRLITLENAAFSAKFGMDLDAMAPVINSGSGWSAQSELVLPALSSGQATTDTTLAQVVDNLDRLTRLGAALGIPLLITNAVHGTYVACANRLGSEQTLDAVAAQYAIEAATCFAPAP